MDGYPRVVIVALTRKGGDVWGVNAEHDEKTLQTAEKAQEAVMRATCRRCALEVRAGVLSDIRKDKKGSGLAEVCR